MTLATRVGQLKFKTPLILGSGRITETPGFFLSTQPFGCSGMVTRSLREVIPPERLKIPAPRYHVFDDGRSMLNCEWCNEESWEQWRDVWGKEVKQAGGRLIVSLSGRDIASCQNLIVAFSTLGCVDAFEINISCAHSCSLHGNLNVDTDHLAKTVSICKQTTDIPIWTKLAYSPVIAVMAKVAEESGTDAIVCTNTIGPGLILDTETAMPVLGIRGGAGGVSGAAIFPIALWCVATVSQAVGIPVVGVGGVDNASKLIQMLMAGASLVQLYTAPALQGQSIFTEILNGVESFLTEHPQYNNLNSIIGASQRYLSDEKTCFESTRPIVDSESCSGCGECIKACAFDALTLRDNTAKIEIENCIGCNACSGICRAGAILPARKVG